MNTGTVQKEIDALMGAMAEHKSNYEHIRGEHDMLLEGLLLLKAKLTLDNEQEAAEETIHQQQEHDQELVNDAKRDLMMDDDVIEAEEEDENGPDYAKEPNL